LGGTLYSMLKNKVGIISGNLYLLFSCKIEQIQRLLLKFENKSAVDWDFKLVSKEFIEKKDAQNIPQIYLLILKIISRNTSTNLPYELEFSISKLWYVTQKL
jgi:hypothetical protein